MIDSLPLEAFGDEDDSNQSDTASWGCQWCGAAIPLGATSCPVCDGAPCATSLPDAVIDPDRDLREFFSDPGPGAGVAGAMAEHVLGFYGGSERREHFQKNYQEELRRQLDGVPRRVELPPDPVGMCRWCNTANAEDAVFCESCGTRLPPRAEVEARVPVNCQWCAAVIEEGATVCPSCGCSTTGDPEKQVAGLTDLTPEERAAEYAFGQVAPRRRPMTGLPGTIYTAQRIGRALFRDRKP